MKDNKKDNILVTVFKAIIGFFDKILITPISKIAYFIKDKFKVRVGLVDKILNQPTVLLYISLLLAFMCFLFIDSETTALTDTKSDVIANVDVVSEYNEEAFVIEGLPTKADIFLRGKSGELYLARQLGNHRISVDLSDLDAGTHKVSLEYNNPVKNLKYTLSPGEVTVVIYPKVSEVRTLSIDVINTDKLDQTLVVSNVLLDRDEIIIKSYKEKLSTIANVKAIVDVNAISAKESGTYTLENVKLVAYDENGSEVDGIEVVPSTVKATVTITSPSKTVPLKIVPTGEVRPGSAISSITSSVTNVTVYADEVVLNDLNYIEINIDVTNLYENKVYQKVINKPSGARSISETAVTINVKMEEETSKEYENITVVTEGLKENLRASAASENDAKVTVAVKGVKSLLDKLESSSIKAYVDLSNITEPGTYSVPVYVSGEDVKFTYTSKTKTIQIIVTTE